MPILSSHHRLIICQMHSLGHKFVFVFIGWEVQGIYYVACHRHIYTCTAASVCFFLFYYRPNLGRSHFARLTHRLEFYSELNLLFAPSVFVTVSAFWLETEGLRCICPDLSIPTTASFLNWNVGSWRIIKKNKQFRKK